MIQPADRAGFGTGGWELVGSDGVCLRLDGPKQLAISSIQQQLRRAGASVREAGAEDGGVAADAGSGSGRGTHVDADSGKYLSGGDKVSDVRRGLDVSGTAEPGSYSWYRMEIVNRSITDEAKRDVIRAHLVWLANKLDEDSLDHQLMTLKYELMAGTDASLTADFKMRAQAIQANKADIEEEP